MAKKIFCKDENDTKAIGAKEWVKRQGISCSNYVWIDGGDNDELWFFFDGRYYAILRYNDFRGEDVWEFTKEEVEDHISKLYSVNFSKFINFFRLFSFRDCAFDGLLTRLFEGGSIDILQATKRMTEITVGISSEKPSEVLLDYRARLVQAIDCIDKYLANKDNFEG